MHDVQPLSLTPAAPVRANRFSFGNSGGFLLIKLEDGRKVQIGVAVATFPFLSHDQREVSVFLGVSEFHSSGCDADVRTVSCIREIALGWYPNAMKSRLIKVSLSGVIRYMMCADARSDVAAGFGERLVKRIALERPASLAPGVLAARAGFDVSVSSFGSRLGDAFHDPDRTPDLGSWGFDRALCALPELSFLCTGDRSSMTLPSLIQSPKQAEYCCLRLRCSTMSAGAVHRSRSRS